MSRICGLRVTTDKSLLSVVAQAFALTVFIYLYEGDDLPPSDNVDEGCQWEIQADEGWVPY
jgi:hypothetical protein